MFLKAGKSNQIVNVYSKTVHFMHTADMLIGSCDMLVESCELLPLGNILLGTYQHFFYKWKSAIIVRM